MTSYSCGDLEVIREGASLRTPAHNAVVPASIGWSDGEGDHFVNFPTSPSDVDAVDYVVPHDPYADAVERVYDTSQGRSRVDWRVTKERVCRARGGYTDAFARWADGASFEQVSTQLSLGSSDRARELVHKVLATMNKRYYANR